MSSTRHGSRSDEQMQAQADALQAIAPQLKAPSLNPDYQVDVGSGWLSVDGFFEDSDQVVLVEVNAHIGRMKPGTRNKVFKDAFKMLFLSALMETQWRAKRVRRFLVFLDEEAQKSFGGNTWAGAAFKKLGLDTAVCPVRPSQRKALQDAQRRQDLSRTP
jgi:hypothetical protein